jgi:hypothetical protein
MPITPPGLQGLLMPLVTAAGIKGTSASSLVSAISIAVTTWMQTLVVQTNDVGLLGVGVGTGKAIVTPPALVGPLVGAAAASLKGTAMVPLMTAIGNGVASFVASQVMVQTTHPGIGVGAGIGTLKIPGPAPLQGLLSAQFSAVKIMGTSMPSLAQAIATGLATGMATAIITVAITGTPIVPPPVTGSSVGIGKLI